MTKTLYIAAAISNPLLWRSRGELAKKAIADWLKEPNVHVFLGEVAYGSRRYELDGLASDRVTHVPLRATTMAWSKENVLNIVINRMPPDMGKVVVLDADITFRRAGWATGIINALDLYPVIQPWDTAYDLGPHDEHMQTHKSFASLYHADKPVLAGGKKFWKFQGGPYEYAHTGYAWAFTRKMLDHAGGLFELGGMGSGDHHMAIGMVGGGVKSVPGGAHPNYIDAVGAWASRAATAINGKLGFVHGTIEHPFHGRKGDRGYQSRWGMFLEHGFDPTRDLKTNTYGVIEFAGNKPDLERDFDNYLRSREEDVNTLT